MRRSQSASGRSGQGDTGADYAGMGGAGLQAENFWDIRDLLRMVKRLDFIWMSRGGARAWGSRTPRLDQSVIAW